MSLHMNFVFLAKRTLLKTSLYVVRSAVGVVMSPGKLIILPPTVSRMRGVSDFAVVFQPQFFYM